MTRLPAGIIYTGYGNSELIFDDIFSSDPLEDEQIYQEILQITHELENPNLSTKEQKKLENKRDFLANEIDYK